MVEFTFAPDLSADTEEPWNAEPLACVSTELWAIQKVESKAAAKNEAVILFM